MSPPSLISEVRVSAGEDNAVRLVRYEVIVDHRLVSMHRRCPDCCGGPPETVTPPPGYDAAIVMVHDATCPAFGRALHGEDGEQ